MAKIKVDIKGLKELQQQLRNIPKELVKDIDQELGKAVKEMERGAVRDAPVDQNTLKAGIHHTRKAPLDWTFESSAFHDVYMEFGTKARYKPIPGVDPSEFKVTEKGTGKGFYDSILDWVKRKKISGSYNVKTRRRVGSKTEQQIEDEQTAFAIYLSILRHGVRPHPFFFHQVDRVKPKLIKGIQKVVDDKRIK